jgi:hypothetical protein
VEGRKVPTGPVSSLSIARKIADEVKTWVAERGWTLTAPIQQLPQPGSPPVNPLEVRTGEEI